MSKTNDSISSRSENVAICTVGGKRPSSIGKKEPKWVEITDVNDDEFYVRGYTKPLRLTPIGKKVPDSWVCGTELLIDGKLGMVLRAAYVGSREDVRATVILRPVKYILFPTKSQLVGLETKKPLMMKIIKHGHIELVCECLRDNFRINLKARSGEHFPSDWVEGSVLEVNVATHSIRSVTIPNKKEQVRRDRVFSQVPDQTKKKCTIETQNVSEEIPDVSYMKSCALWDITDTFQFVRTDGVVFEWLPSIRKTAMTDQERTMFHGGTFILSRNDAGSINTVIAIPSLNNLLGVPRISTRSSAEYFVDMVEDEITKWFMDELSLTYGPPKEFSDGERPVVLIGVPDGTTGVKCGVVTSSDRPYGMTTASVSFDAFPDRGIVVVSRVQLELGSLVEIDFDKKEVLNSARPVERLRFRIVERAKNNFRPVILD